MEEGGLIMNSNMVDTLEGVSYEGLFCFYTSLYTIVIVYGPCEVSHVFVYNKLFSLQ